MTNKGKLTEIKGERLLAKRNFPEAGLRMATRMTKNEQRTTLQQQRCRN